MCDSSMLRNDLLSLSEEKFFIKYIAKSNYWYFTEYLQVPQDQILDKIDLLKEIISTYLKIGFHSLQIVGSAKTGFSLSPRNLLQPFHDATESTSSSDIDIAVISNRLYRYWWEELKRVSNLFFIPDYQGITSSVFRGFINEKNITHVEYLRPQWEDIFCPINRSLQDKLNLIHPISYRIYRSWEDLQEYQLNSISEARKKLEE